MLEITDRLNNAYAICRAMMQCHASRQSWTHSNITPGGFTPLKWARGGIEEEFGDSHAPRLRAVVDLEWAEV